MLLKAYLKIEEQLQTIAALKLVDWFNNQYEGTIHTAPCAFIEFPEPLRMQQLNRQYQHAQFKARIHIVSKVLAEQDGHINRTMLQNHELLNQQVYNLLHGFSAVEAVTGNPIFNSLTRTEYQHYHYNHGWMLTTQDFEGVLYQLIIDNGQLTINNVQLIVKSEK